MEKEGRLLALIVAGINPKSKKVLVFTREHELSDVGFFQRSGAKEAFKFIARESLPALQPGTRNSIVHDKHNCHIQLTRESLGAYAFCTQSYPRRVAFAFLAEVLNAFRKALGQEWKNREEDQNISLPEIKRIFEKYVDPAKADVLTEALKKVEETNIILHDNIRKLLERQGNLQDLIGKSKDLNQASKMFLKQSEQMNKSCCSLI